MHTRYGRRHAFPRGECDLEETGRWRQRLWVTPPPNFSLTPPKLWIGCGCLYLLSRPPVSEEIRDVWTCLSHILTKVLILWKNKGWINISLPKEFWWQSTRRLKSADMRVSRISIETKHGGFKTMGGYLMSPRSAHKNGYFFSIDHKFTLTFILPSPWRKSPSHWQLPKLWWKGSWMTVTRPRM